LNISNTRTTVLEIIPRKSTIMAAKLLPERYGLLAVVDVEKYA
jgi:hypothetical protein